ncbi:MAG: LD-carboxypeptidase [Bacteroidetes bacterium]|nr:LD-carboxypeptidase [Bacteroidota bacterium]MBS1648124.1 LD-carboxypeptidase [Bacteroidota bacterium]
MIKIPPYLKKGDCIGLVCPSGFMAYEKTTTCVEVLQKWGYKVKMGKTVGGKQKNYFSGTDEERLHDLQMMLDDDNINAILCARGGYGMSRIIDAINFHKFKKKPKWIIGFSDITVLHAHIHNTLKIATLHAPMAAAFNDGEFKNEYVQSLNKALKGVSLKYTCNIHSFNKLGKATGELVGGNLSLIAHLIGSSSSFNTKNKILFIEDVGEYVYNVDRMFIQLKRAGMLQNLAGLVIGGFTEMKDTTASFGKNVYDVLQEHISEYKYPVCFNFPVSHDKENYALKVGVVYELHVATKNVQLKEIR